MAKKLKKCGLENISLDNVITSGDVARYVIQKNVSSCIETPVIYHLGEDRNKYILIDIHHKLTLNISEADILLMTLYRDEHENIHEFDQFLERVAQKENINILCANPDTTILNTGIVRYCAGHFAGLIRNSGGIVTYTGKPETIIFNMAFIQSKYSNILPKRILMIGDTLETDILGANKSGINSALVMTGNTSRLFYTKNNSLDHVLEQIYNVTQKVNIIPTFVTQLTKLYD